jgi:catechol 2,3-dioxygenase-like lactoylglutathione lyase family enzyme
MLGSATATVMVDDLDRALAFYVGTLGLTAGARYGPHYAEVHASGLKLGLHPRRAGDHDGGEGNLSIGFTVESIDDAVETLSRSGISFTREDTDANRLAFFHDPDGTPLYLYQPV